MSLNIEVTALVAALKHPMAKEITALRKLILASHKGLTENIKWNSPNFALGSEDRITLRIQPIKHIQIILHHGSKPRKPKAKPITDTSGLLEWKGTERAVLEIPAPADLTKHRREITALVKKWVDATT
jgi:hypothetical protein